MLLSAGLAITMLTACIEDVAKDKVQAEVQEVAPGEERQRAPAADGAAWTVDAEASTVRALGAKITATHPIDFPDVDAEVVVSEGNLSSLSYTVQMATLVSDHPKLTKHLKNDHFFDVPNHPTSTFTSSSFTPGSDAAGMTHTVTGVLTIRGNRKEVTFPARVQVEGSRLTAHTEFALDRRDFGIVYPGKPDDLVQDKVVLTVHIEAVQPAS